MTEDDGIPHREPKARAESDWLLEVDEAFASGLAVGIVTGVVGVLAGAYIAWRLAR